MTNVMLLSTNVHIAGLALCAIIQVPLARLNVICNGQSHLQLLDLNAIVPFNETDHLLRFF
jgi:hypothetical protein